MNVNHEEMAEVPNPVLVIRSLFGGVLMGLANVVPGISGGTMLLAAGIYTDFIAALSELTRFRFRVRSLLVMACVAGAAVLGILLFAGSLKDAVLDHRWIMYSLFIGLTLGGLPLVLRLVDKASPKLFIAAGVAFALMLALAWFENHDAEGVDKSSGMMLFLAGLAGASAMILPGLSGSYLLLLMGQYVPILTAVDQFKEALKVRDVSAAIDPAVSVLVPVGVGVVVGVLVVGNLLKWMLNNQRQITFGILIGLLIGSVPSLWPFQEGIAPVVGDVIKGQIVDQAMLDSIDKKDWRIERFYPAIWQVLVSLFLIVLGFMITMAVASLGKSRNSSGELRNS